MPSNPFDPRASLILGDQFVRQGLYAGAIAAYQPVASHYLAQGFALKAVAVLKQIVQIAERDPAALSRQAITALRLLVDAYRALGLEPDALTTEARLREYAPAS